MDGMTMAALGSFFVLVVGWMALPASKSAAEPARVAVTRAVPRTSAAEA